MSIIEGVNRRFINQQILSARFVLLCLYRLDESEVVFQEGETGVEILLDQR